VKEREVDGSERHYRGEREKNLPSVLKVPRQCPFVVLVSVRYFTGAIEEWCLLGCYAVWLL
jgi:hypothetical protein